MEEVFYLGYVSFTNSGLLIFERYLGELKMDSNLLTGMLSALQALSQEITSKKLDEFEFHKFQIYIIPSTNYQISHAIITNGAYSKHHAYEILMEMSKEFENKHEQYLTKSPINNMVVQESFGEYIVEKLKTGNSYLSKLDKIRSEFFDETEKQDVKTKKDKLRGEFF